MEDEEEEEEYEEEAGERVELVSLEREGRVWGGGAV